ncbi:hypothetical protein JOD95_000732 [Curtobacterium sp. 1310]|nr:hypothetical protein [Curtobacterium sp. 1310]
MRAGTAPPVRHMVALAALAALAALVALVALVTRGAGGAGDAGRCRPKQLGVPPLVRETARGPAMPHCAA